MMLSEFVENARYNARRRREDHVDHRNHNDHRNEMRRIGRRLNHLRKSPMPARIHRQRQNDRQRKARQKRIEAQNQRIFHVGSEIRHSKQPDEVLQSYPFASGHSLARLVILKRDQYAVHRAVIHHDDIHKRRNQKQVQLPVAQNPFAQRLPVVGAIVSNSVHRYSPLHAVEKLFFR